jgi:hypothetical protein
MIMPTNCKNCGAVLTGSKCEYCRTEYGGKPKLTQAQYDAMQHDLCQLLISRGGLYSSVLISAFRGQLEGYDLSDVVDTPIIVRDPAEHNGSYMRLFLQGKRA